MTTARREIVDVAVTRWYHCISKCVRSIYLLSEESGNGRKQWIEDRLKLLTDSFAVSVGGFSVMDNHLHLLCRLDPDQPRNWSAEQVIRRWIAIYPPLKLDLEDPQTVKMWVEHQAQKLELVELYRQRLSNLGWFMKALKEPLARICNRQDGVKGAFWEARFKSIAVLDEEALLATCAYIDLNPVAAGMAADPESSPHTSIRQRVRHAKGCGKLSALKAALQGSVAGSDAAGNFESHHWLVPLDDRRQLPLARQEPGIREGMVGGFSLGSYLLLVEYTGRLYREGKTRINDGVKDVMDRLGTNAEFWNDRIKKMLTCSQLRGCFFACQPQSLEQVKAHRKKRTANLAPQPG